MKRERDSVDANIGANTTAPSCCSDKLAVVTLYKKMDHASFTYAKNTLRTSFAKRPEGKVG